jgi:hypothetical protein
LSNSGPAASAVIGLFIEYFPDHQFRPYRWFRGGFLSSLTLQGHQMAQNKAAASFIADRVAARATEESWLGAIVDCKQLCQH